MQITEQLPLSKSQRENVDKVLQVAERIAPFVSPIVAIMLLYYLYQLGPEMAAERSRRTDLIFYTFLLMWVGLTSSWNLIGGYTGYIDFGHSVFVGLGSYVIGIAMVQRYDYSFWQALPVTFAVGAIFAAVVGWPTLRLKGPYFAIAMLGVLVSGRELSRIAKDWTGGGEGISFFRDDFSDPLTIYKIFLAIAGATFFISLWVYRTQLGQMLQSIREDEIGAETRGMNTTLLKIGAFMLAGGFSAMIGGTLIWWKNGTEPNIAFPPYYHIQIIMMTMLGGLGRPWGPVLGAALFYKLREEAWANLGNLHLVVTGTLLIFIVLFMPGGILAFFDPENRGLTWQVRRLRKIFNPDISMGGENKEVATQSVHSEASTLPDLANLPPKPERGPLLLQGRGVIKDFGGLRAVSEADFEIYQGEIVGLLGPNGSGKTTLFNCISGVNPATSGTIMLNGSDITKKAPWQISRQNLTRTFQKIRVFSKLTVYQNMLLGRQWRGVPPWLWMSVAPSSVRQQADELIDFLLLTRVKDNLAANISGGQQRLLEIGMTLMSNPEVVLLDEATSGVNPALVEQIKANILQLNREKGVTFFLVEHNMSFAMELCDRIYVLDYGAVIAEGKPEEIQNNPQVIEAYFGRDE